MRRAVVTLVVSVAAALAAVPLGIAATASGTDARGDVEGSPAGGSGGADIVRASAGRDSRGQLVHKVTVSGNAADPSGNGVVPALYIELPEEANPVAECALYVGHHKGRAGVYRCGTNERRGSARVVRTSASTIRYTFSPRALGNPSEYNWAAFTRSRSTDRGSWTLHDRLPTPEDEFLRYSLR